MSCCQCSQIEGWVYNLTVDSNFCLHAFTNIWMAKCAEKANRLAQVTLLDKKRAENQTSEN